MKKNEANELLASMIILVDRREQPTARAEKRYQSFGIPYRKVTLSYGDYSYNVQLPDGHWLFDEDQAIRPPIAIERKMNLDELASCFTHSRDCFEREFQRAKANNARIILLVENANWENLINGRYNSRFNQNAYLASICSWLVRYDIQLIFCKEETTGKIIREILFRDLKNRIELGQIVWPAAVEEGDNDNVY